MFLFAFCRCMQLGIISLHFFKHRFCHCSSTGSCTKLHANRTAKVLSIWAGSKNLLMTFSLHWILHLHQFYLLFLITLEVLPRSLKHPVCQETESFGVFCLWGWSFSVAFCPINKFCMDLWECHLSPVDRKIESAFRMSFLNQPPQEPDGVPQATLMLCVFSPHGCWLETFGSLNQITLEEVGSF